VGLELTVDPRGTSRVKVVRAAGFGFDDSAVAAARQMRFRPAMHDGKPVASTVLFDQRFVLRPHLTAESSAEADGAAHAEGAASSPPPLPPATDAPPVPAYESVVQSRGPLTAASSSTIRNRDFELRPRSTPNDLLRVVPGLLAVQHQGGGKADQLFLRGFDADHGSDVAIYVDGVPINLPSHAHGQGFADLHWIIPEAIERIDVVKGPYDARYGDFATAGAVNLVTRDRFDESSVQYTLGMLPSIGGRAVASGRFVGVAAPSLPGWAARLHPWVAFEAAYDQGPFDRAEHLYRYNLFAKLSYDLGPRTVAGIFFSTYGGGWIGSGRSRARGRGRAPCALRQRGPVGGRPHRAADVHRLSAPRRRRQRDRRHRLRHALSLVAVERLHVLLERPLERRRHRAGRRARLRRRQAELALSPSLAPHLAAHDAGRGGALGRRCRRRLSRDQPGGRVPPAARSVS